MAPPIRPAPRPGRAGDRERIAYRDAWRDYRELAIKSQLATEAATAQAEIAASLCAETEKAWLEVQRKHAAALAACPELDKPAPCRQPDLTDTPTTE
jgi:hypothetical protein